MAGKKANDRLLRNGPLAQNNADGQQVQVHAKFQNPLEKALRYQRATARDFYRAWHLLYKVRGEAVWKSCVWEKAAHRCPMRDGAASQLGHRARTIGCEGGTAEPDIGEAKTLLRTRWSGKGN